MPKAIHLFHFVAPAKELRRLGHRPADVPVFAYSLKFELHCLAAKQGCHENNSLNSSMDGT
jgi:hypothetical protein